MTAWPRLIRIETQLQTTQTDTTKRLAPDGAGGVEWAAAGGGGACDHEHTFDRFVALGGSPETVTLTTAPMGAVMVHRGSPTPLSLIDPSAVTVVGSDVSLDTTVDDIVVIFYATACTCETVTASGALTFTDDDLTIGDPYDIHATQISSGFAADIGQTVSIDITTPLSPVDADTKIGIFSVIQNSFGPGALVYDVGTTHYEILPDVDATDWVVIVIKDPPGEYIDGLTGVGTYEVTTPC